MTQLLVIESVSIRQDAHGRYSLNDLHKAAMANGKATESQRPGAFLQSDPIKAFIDALDADQPDATRIASVHSVKGGKSQGTWAAELVAIRYAAWIDPAFEVRVYRAFRNSVAADKDWRKMRHAAASTTKVANDILKFIRESNGKDTEPKHYMNEARMVNWALSGKFEKIDRDGLSQDELDLMAYLQERNAVLIGRGIGYDERKPMIKQYAMDWRLDRSMGLLK